MIQLIQRWILPLLILLGAGPITAQPTLDFLGNYSYGVVSSVVTSEDWVYFGSSGTLMVARIDEVGQLEIVKEIDFSSPIWTLFHFQNYLYVNSSDQFRIYDTSTPDNPTFVGEIPMPSPYLSVIGEQYWYSIVEEGENHGIALLDLEANPTSPQELGRWLVDDDPKSMDVSGPTLYVATTEGSTSQLHVVDTTNPALPMTLKVLKNLPSIYQLVVQGNHLYLSTFNRGLVIMDISQPGEPTPVGQMPLDQPSLFSLDEDRGIMVAGDQLSSLDFSDPRQPQILDTVTISGRSYGPLLTNYSFFVPLGSAGLQVGQIAITGSISVSDHYQATRLGNGLAVYDNIAYLSGQEEFSVIDVSEARNPIFLSSITLPNPSFAIAVDGSLGAVSTGQQGSDFFQIHFLDLTDKDGLDLLSSVELADWSFRIRLRDDFAYIANLAGGLVIMNLSDPSNPVHVGTFDSRATDIFLQGDYAYVSDTEGRRIMVIDISNPNAPFLESDYSPQYLVPFGFIKVGNIGYVMNGEDIQVVDFQDLQSPILVATFPTGSFNFHPVISGNVLYTSTGSGIRKYDLSDPLNPTEIGTITYLLGSMAAVENSRLYFTEGIGGGLYIFRDLASLTFSDGFESGDLSRWSQNQP